MADANTDLRALRDNPDNPRTITQKRLKMLDGALREFGDLSGIVFNRRDGGMLLCGHQRKTVFLEHRHKLVITHTYPEPTRTGTVREGYIEVDGERFAYRETDWPRDKAAAAAICANKNAGYFSGDGLRVLLDELQQHDYNMDLTMFEQKDLDTLYGIKDEDVDVQPEPDNTALGYNLLVVCRDAAHQAQLLARFRDEGLNCRPQ
jgi:hypothetical protein